MLSLSHGVSYVVQALVFLESGACPTRFVRDVAKCAGLPPAYLAKLFKKLVDAGILESKRGWKGGTRLARPAEDISLFEISEAIEGAQWIGQCLLGYSDCDDFRNCPTHEFWKSTRRDIERKLRTTTLPRA